MTDAPRIWRDFGSALPFQTRLTQIKPVLPLSNEHGSQVKDQGRRQCCHNKHKNFPIGLHVMYFTFRTRLVHQQNKRHPMPTKGGGGEMWYTLQATGARKRPGPRLWEITNKCTYRYIYIYIYIYYIIISLASDMFRPSIVAIFREVTFEGILHRMLKQYTSIKC